MPLEEVLVDGVDMLVIRCWFPHYQREELRGIQEKMRLILHPDLENDPQSSELQDQHWGTETQRTDFLRQFQGSFGNPLESRVLCP